MTRLHALVLLSLTLLLAPAVAAAAEGDIAVFGVERFQFRQPNFSASELSGITWVGGNRYLVVGDTHDRIYPLHIELDPETATILEAELDTPVTLLDGAGDPLRRTDLEDIAYDHRNRSVFTVDEIGPMLREHDPHTGMLVREVRAGEDEGLDIFARSRLNLAWEALTLAPDGEHIWLANEEALRGDGPRTTTDAGSLVRIQRLTRDFAPAGQWAYRTDTLPGAITMPARFARRAAAGLSALLAIDGGRLLAMERHFGGTDAGLAHFRIRIYELDFTHATDITEIPRLRRAADVQPVGKRLLWETRSYAPIDNFEGMTLGPRLANGDRSLLLVADNNGGETHAMFALRLRIGVPLTP